ncbi:MAG TPA: aldolase/citrate lyase family protein [Longimicrobiales bacterium]
MIARGEAGHRGPDVRSDLHVEVELGGDVGVDLEVTSKVEALYGEAIRADARRVLGALEVDHARVRVRDEGALPWVVMARVEAAAVRAGVEPAPGTLPARARSARGPSPRDRLRRSRLYLPGDSPRFMVNAGLHGPDAVILDLEDSVHPDHKHAARLLVRNAIRAVDFGAAEVMVRINQGVPGLEDLDAVIPEAPDVILVPKVEHAETVLDVAARIHAIRDEEGLDPSRPVWLMPILESALGIEHAFDIARAHESVVALTIGLEDYTADLGVAKTRDGQESAWARKRLVNAARAAGVQAIDSVYGDLDDEEGLRAWGIRARSMGFTGMGCVHPRQIRPIHESFAPGEDALARALSIVEAFRDASERGLGVVSLGSKMIDPPVVERARRLVADAKRMGLVPNGAAGTPVGDGP